MAQLKSSIGNFLMNEIGILKIILNDVPANGSSREAIAYVRR